ERVAQVPQVVGVAGHELVVEEHAVGNVAAGDERVLQLGADVDGFVVHDDVGVLLVEGRDRLVEDLEEVALSIPDGDLALRRGLCRSLELGGVGRRVVSADRRTASGQAEGERGEPAERECSGGALVHGDTPLCGSLPTCAKRYSMFAYVANATIVESRSNEIREVGMPAT